MILGIYFLTGFPGFWVLINIKTSFFGFTVLGNSFFLNYVCFKPSSHFKIW